MLFLSLFQFIVQALVLFIQEFYFFSNFGVQFAFLVLIFSQVINLLFESIQLLFLLFDRVSFKTDQLFIRIDLTEVFGIFRQQFVILTLQIFQLFLYFT